MVNSINHFLKHKKLFILGCVFTFMCTCVQLSTAVALKKLLESKNVNDIFDVGKLILVFIVIGPLVNIIRIKTEQKWINLNAYDIKNELMHNILKGNNKANRELLSVLTNDVSNVTDNFVFSFYTGVNGLVGFFLSIIFSIRLKISLTMLIVALNFLPTSVGYFLGKRMNTTNGLLSSEQGKYTSKLIDLLSGFEVFFGLHLRSRMVKEQTMANKGIEDARSKLVFLWGMSSSLIQLVSNFAIIIFIVATMVLVSKGSTTIGGAFAILQVADIICGSFKKSINAGMKMRGTQSVCNKLINILACDCSSTKEIGEILTIETRDVSVDYEGSNALNRFSFVFEKGKKYIVVGASGSGKSTLLDVIANNILFRGDVLINGENANEYKGDIARHVLLQHQESYIFDDTIQNNICLYKKISSDKLALVIKEVGFDEAIRRKPDGFNTELSEGGIELSGGEIQRLLLCRTLLHSPEVVLLDEPTSHLDEKSSLEIENLLMNRLESTLVLVTHHLDPSILRQSDQILMLKDGSLCEAGTYSDLIEKQSSFYNLMIAEKT